MKRQSFLAAAFLCIAGCGLLHAEDDSGKLFPSFKDLRLTNVFFEANAGYASPLFFTSQDLRPMTDKGWEFSAAVGYNFGGWLFSLEFSRDSWGEGKREKALMENFHNNIFLFKAKKIITNRTWSKIPAWIQFTPGMGIGLDCITTDYYRSTLKKQLQEVTSIEFGDKNAQCLFLKPFLEIDFYVGNDLFIPFIGGDYNLFFDKSIGGGSGEFFTVYAGIRTYPLGLFHRNEIKAARKAREAEKAKAELPIVKTEVPKAEPEKPVELGEAKAEIRADIHENFTPDDDGINDFETLIPSAGGLEFAPDSWKIEIFDPKENLFRTFEGKGPLPESLKWDGKSDSGERVYSLNVYKIKLTVLPSEGDKKRTGKTELLAEDSIKTGVALIEVIPNKKWKMIVNTIHFDPDRATFNKIPKDQIAENEETISAVAAQLKAHSDCEVMVVGYANNVTNTAREDREELIPLSRERAAAVLGLLNKAGFDTSTMQSQGRGGANAIAAWKDHDNWWKNRRVEFELTKPGADQITE